VVEKKWPTIKPAFCNFDINRIAAFTDADIQRLLNYRGIIRNPYKLHAIVENAKRSSSGSGSDMAVSKLSLTALTNHRIMHK
jgi:DNA-3-methyladenine glycosylase I